MKVVETDEATRGTTEINPIPAISFGAHGLSKQRNGCTCDGTSPLGVSDDAVSGYTCAGMNEQIAAIRGVCQSNEPNRSVVNHYVVFSGRRQGQCVRTGGITHGRSSYRGSSGTVGVLECHACAGCTDVSREVKDTT